MTTSKSILTVSSIAIAMMFGGGVYVLMHLNTLAKPQIEKYASQALGVAVSIGELNVGIQDMKASAKNIRIANPAGFSNANAVVMESADVKLESLAQGLVTINSININGAQANLEVKESGTNFHALQKGMNPVASPKGDEAVKVIIKSFTLNGAKVNPSVTLIAKQDLEPIALSNVVVRNIGTREGGVLPGEAAKQIVSPVLKSATKAAGSAGYYEGLSSDVLKDMGVSQIKAVGDQIQNEVDKIGDSIKGLFN